MARRVRILHGEEITVDLAFETAMPGVAGVHVDRVAEFGRLDPHALPADANRGVCRLQRFQRDAGGSGTNAPGNGRDSLRTIGRSMMPCATRFA